MGPLKLSGCVMLKRSCPQVSSPYRGRVAALIKKGAAPEAIRAARRELAAANVRRLVAVERARQGLPPAGDGSRRRDGRRVPEAA